MTRTQRGTIDELAGYTIYDPAPGALPQDDYFLYGNYTVWGVGLITFGPPTAQQVAWMTTIASNSNLATFPGDWIRFSSTFPPNSVGPIEVWSGGTRIAGVLLTEQSIRGAQSWSIGGLSGTAAFYWSDLVSLNGTASADTINGTSAAETINGGSGNDVLNGGGGADAIYGGDGNDRLIGDTGVDRLFGGAGDDWLEPGTETPATSYNFAADTQIDGGAGFDILALDYSASTRSVSVSGDVQLTRPGVTNVEAVALTGSAFSDVLTGTANSDQLFGGAGFDFLSGGAGNDLLDAGQPSASSVTMLGQGGTSVATAVSLDHLFASAPNGPAVSMTISQPAANAVGFGAQTQGTIYSFTVAQAGDQMSIDYALPSFGFDNYFFDFIIKDANGVEVETVPFNQPVVFPQAGTYTLQVWFGRYNVWGSSSMNVTLTLEGGTVLAANELRGGLGDDTYRIYAATDQVIELAGQGTDTVESTVSYTLGANVENLSLVGTAAISGIGNAAANVMIGNGAANVLTGGIGADVLTGGNGKDMFRDTVSGLNGDTITDFAVGDRIVITDATINSFAYQLSGNTLLYSGGSLTFSSSPGTIVAYAAASGGVELAISTHNNRNDINNDQRSDFIVRDPQSGWLTDWLSASNGSFASNSPNVSIPLTTDWKVVGTGDYNGDGRDDMLLRSDDGWLSNWLGTPNGAFANNGANVALFFTTDWKVAANGDFNGDGKADLLLRRDDGWLTNWLGTANGSFTSNGANTSLFFTPDWKIASTGDFNADGYTDILLRRDDGWVTNWLGNSSGGFTNNGANTALFFTTDWKVIGTGDINGDGKDDLILRRNDGWITDWLGTSNGGFTNNGANTALFLTTDWTIGSIADFNGDGREDLLLRNDSGWMTNWLGTASGSFTNNGANFSTFIAPNWIIQDPFL